MTLSLVLETTYLVEVALRSVGFGEEGVEDGRILEEQCVSEIGRATCQRMVSCGILDRGSTSDRVQRACRMRTVYAQSGRASTTIEASLWMAQGVRSLRHLRTWSGFEAART